MANSKRMQVQGRLSLGVLVVGFLLLVYMITVEDEPGALPLLLIVAGSAGYCISRYRLGKQTGRAPE